MPVRVGVDVGGTFTDAVRVDEESGEVTRTKVLTTAADQSEGTLSALQRLVEDPGSVASFHHGYTVGLNAALTRNGAPTGLLVTAGHRDTVDHGRVWRPFDLNLYDPTWERPHQARPIVQRRLRREVPERMRENGEVLQPLDEDATRRELEFLKSEGVEAVGICFMNAYEHPEHEQRVREIVAEVMPEAYVQSSGVRAAGARSSAFMSCSTRTPARRWSATSTACSAASRGRFRLAGRDHADERGAAVDRASSACRCTRCSPARWPDCSAPRLTRVSCSSGREPRLSWTSGARATDLGVIRDGDAEVTNEWQLEHAMPLSITTLDVRSIGAGGGQPDPGGRGRVAERRTRIGRFQPGSCLLWIGRPVPAMSDAYVAMGLLGPICSSGVR